jgi:catechol 2,3-dioxygenase-like lactoylglutathione lyase family enzyme
MQARVTVITLCVHDLEKAVAFYRDGLGLRTAGIIGREIEQGAVAFFKMNEDSLILALWPRTSLAHDLNLTPGPRGALEFTIGHNVNSKSAVDAVLAEAARAGATIAAPGKDRAWGGYSGYFQDPDGHLWEVVWNPQLPVPE